MRILAEQILDNRLGFIQHFAGVLVMQQGKLLLAPQGLGFRAEYPTTLRAGSNLNVQMQCRQHLTNTSAVWTGFNVVENQRLLRLRNSLDNQAPAPGCKRGSGHRFQHIHLMSQSF